MRAFVAVDVPEAVRTAVAGAVTRIRAAAPDADVRWVRPEAFHLTLKFLGQVDEARVPVLAKALAGVASASAPVTLSAVGLGCFPDGRRPRVVWAAIAAGARDLGVLARAVDQACEPLGFPTEGRPWRAHLTVGRVRTPRGVGGLTPGLRAEEGRELGTWTARELTLYRSRLGHGGAVHEALARLALGRPTP